ncbi:hypothetical protein LI99_18980 [Mycolicibacterium smegmatis]|nr:hypothetical protein LJ00_18975 [Mycolicibacterium smegmatis MC2 155]AIU15563.1 hypothetical protein LI99_18980 [Mycolicibacterium smegmatis]AIU22186.1 hypothetical protein LI98_18985 [Mycolicibacterium smegmatis]
MHLLAGHRRKRHTRTWQDNLLGECQEFRRQYPVFRPNRCEPKDARVNVVSRVDSLGLWVLSLDLFASTLSTTE